MTSSPQKYWDAALIKMWRKNGTVWDAASLFTALTGKRLADFDPPLKRVPRAGAPFKMQVRFFVASYLPKLSDRLLAQDDPQKDVLLLRKLETSPYDTLKAGLRDNELERERQRFKKNKKVLELNIKLYGARNDATNWNVVKGAVSKTR